MDKNASHRIVRETFENSFDKEKFVYFVKNLLNSFDDAPFVYRGNFIPDAYKKQISVLERIGKYSDGEFKIDILIVHLKKETSVERARSMQRNFIAWYLNGSRGNELKDAALVAFVSPDNNDWRFSLVKMDYKFEEGKNGKMKVKEEFTPARRWSFLVGANENSHTAQSRLAPIMEDDQNNPVLKQLEEAFNIEKVTKEFFEKYRDLFLRVSDTLNDVVKNNQDVKKDFKEKNVSIADFSKKLLGQIVFLYFLQKKGWFGVPMKKSWGDGDKRFLKTLFSNALSDGKNYFNDYLEPLFYEALAKERDDDFYSRFNCKIPFLNGGLFDPISNYDWVNTAIDLPNDLFSNDRKNLKTGDIGDGVLDIFDRYNFTVKEDEPLEKEVAIDPEMLGKVFENLLEVKDRKSKGTYYTPREIVHYMCEQSLINYLATAETVGTGRDLPLQLLTQEDIATLIKYGETAVENEAEVVSRDKETKTYSHKLPKSIRDNAKLIDEKLANIKVCDPAIGSGAFPVGMMNEIIKTRLALNPYLANSTTRQSRTAYSFKRDCIQNSLYGVDIDPGAVEIAKLRLWLSLVVDEEDIKQIKPLPNLDYKIVCGNSLLGVEQNLFNQQLFVKLEELKPLFFNETSGSKKKEYKKQIDDIIAKLTNGRKDFDFEIYFSEVFHENGGFDVVIGNPPYMNVEKIDKQIKNNIKNFKTAYQKYDLYVLFYEKGIDLLKDSGILTFISSNKFLSQGYGLLLRQKLLENTIQQIINFNYDVFNSATVRTCILQLSKNKTPKNLIKIIDVSSKDDKQKFEKCEYEFLEQSAFETTDENNFRINLTNKKIKLLRKLEQNTLRVDDICSVNYGLRPSSEKKGLKKKAFIKKENSKKTYRKYFEGKNMGYWTIKNYSYLDYSPDIMYNPMFVELFEFEKLVGLRTLSDITKLRFIYDNKGYYCNDSVVILTLWHKFEKVEFQTIKRLITKEKIDLSKNYSLKYLQAILNSKMIKFYVNELLYDGTHFYPNHMKQLPVKKISPKQQKPFVNLVNQILKKKKDNPQADTGELEREIDGMMYKLYGLDKKEIKIIESP